MTLVPASSHSPVFSAVRDLTTAEIVALRDTPITVIPAIVGRTIIPLGGAFEYFAGAVGFGHASILVLVENSVTLYEIPASDTGLNGTVDAVAAFHQSVTGLLAPASAVTLVASTVVGGVGPVTGLSIDSAGSLWAPTDVAAVSGGNGAARITVATVGNSFPITAVNVIGKTFTVTGDASAFQPADIFRVYRSTLNNGDYTIVSAVFGAGSTVITVVEAIPSGTANGRGGDSTLGAVGTMSTLTVTTAGAGYSDGSSGDLTAVAPSVGIGAEYDGLTVTSTSDGTARVTVYYAVV